MLCMRIVLEWGLCGHLPFLSTDYFVIESVLTIPYMQLIHQCFTFLFPNVLPHKFPMYGIPQ